MSKGDRSIAATRFSRMAAKKNSLVANINRRKEAGTSRTKSRSTVSEDSYYKMEADWPKKGAKKATAKKPAAKKPAAPAKKTTASKGAKPATKATATKKPAAKKAAKSAGTKKTTAGVKKPAAKKKSS